MNNETEQIFLLNTAPNQSSASTQRMGTLAPPSSQVNLENVQDFSNVCRTCATITEFVMPIFSGEGLQNEIADKIKKHLPIQARQGDELPQVVCYQCANTLLAWHELVKCCMQADVTLRAKVAANHRRTILPNLINTTSLSVEDEIQNNYNRSPYSAQPYRVCVYCSTSHPVSYYKEHLIVEHSTLLFHCEECDSFVDKKDFMVHMSLHASQYSSQEYKIRRNKRRREAAIQRAKRAALAASTAATTPAAQTVAAAPSVSTAAAAPSVSTAAAAPSVSTAAAATSALIAQTTAAAPSVSTAAAAPSVSTAAAAPSVSTAAAATSTLSAQTTAGAPSVPTAAAVPSVSTAAAVPSVPTAAAVPPVSTTAAAPPVSTAAAVPPVSTAAAVPSAPTAAAVPSAPTAAAAPSVPPAAAAPSVPPAAAAPTAAVVLSAPTAAAVSSAPTAAAAPSVPTAAAAPSVPTAAAIPSVSTAADVSSVPTAAAVSSVPTAAAVPSGPTAAAAPSGRIAPTAPANPEPLCIPKTEHDPIIIKTEDIKPPMPLPTSVPAPMMMPVPVKIKQNFQENEFSDHSDMDGFGPLPESLFNAIEDTQDNQLAEYGTGHTLENERNIDESHEFSQSVNNYLNNPIPTLENNNNFNNCSVVIEPIDINNCAGINKAIKSSNTPNNYALPANEDLEDNIDTDQDMTDERGKKNQKKTRKCPYCPKEYTASSSYFYHLKYSHKGSKEHECEVCGKRFGTKSCLTQHVAIHTALYEFECKQCHKQFRSKASLYIHEQTHNGKKTWSCSQCHRSFRWKTHLLRHMKRHAAEKGHVCATCGRGFSVRCDLLRHARTHAAGSFSCDKCGQKFAQQRYLKVHITKKHSTKARKASK